MDESDFVKSQQTLRELAKAQKTLDDVESKMKKFKTRKKQEPSSNLTKAPFPDLAKYFSYLPAEIDNMQQTVNIYNSQNPDPQENAKLTNNRSQFSSLLDKENNSLSINQRLEKQKNSSITKIQQYYLERNSALEERIKQLKQLKQKIVREQKLLLRNNEELQEDIRTVRNTKAQSKAEEMRAEIQTMRNKIKEIEKDNVNISKNKVEIQKHLKETLKGYKSNLKHEVQTRTKSVSGFKCQYH